MGGVILLLLFTIYHLLFTRLLLLTISYLPALMYEHILVTEDSGIATITLNRPEKLNALIGHMRRDLAEALEAAGSDRAIRVVIVTGAGRAFCAGGDVAFMADLIDRQNTEEFSRLLGAARRVVMAIRQMNKPVIGAVNGLASGAGCNLALACDLRIASAEATFSQSFVRLGLHPDWGGTYFVPHLVTPNQACEMFFLGEEMSAEEALRLNVVNRVVAPENLQPAVRELAERLRDAPPISIAAAKQAVYMSQSAELEEMLRYETEAQLRCFESADGREGIQAFMEKRPPKFSGQ